MESVIVHISEGKPTNVKAVEKFYEELEQGSFLLEAKSIKKRSNNQNRYYWGQVIPLVKDGLRAAGYNEVKSKDDAHEVIKALFLKRPIKSDKNDDEIIISGSTATLTTLKFMELIADIQQWAASYLNITIPDPGQALPMFNEPILAHYDYDIKTTIIE
jgi:hypothetical protein